jgi:hypothetical protein
VTCWTLNKYIIVSDSKNLVYIGHHPWNERVVDHGRTLLMSKISTGFLSDLHEKKEGPLSTRLVYVRIFRHLGVS